VRYDDLVADRDRLNQVLRRLSAGRGVSYIDAIALLDDAYAAAGQRGSPPARAVSNYDDAALARAEQAQRQRGSALADVPQTAPPAVVHDGARFVAPVALGAGGPVSKIAIAKIGTFEHGTHGVFTVTESDVADWKKNLKLLPGHRALIDFDHSADRDPRSTVAAGWLTDVDLIDGVPTGTVQWTPAGVEAISSGGYAFFSPVFGAWHDETGERHDGVLSGGALTNKPHFNMPPVHLDGGQE
jgi:hypothetical protein